MVAQAAAVTDSQWQTSPACPLAPTAPARLQTPGAEGSGGAGGPHEHYFLGPFYTTAEVLCTSYIARMVHTLPEWRDMDVLAECEARRLHRVAGWMRACLARPSAQLTGPNKKELVDGLVQWEWSHAV